MENGPVIEPATADDAEAIYEIQRLTWLDTYPNEDLGITAEDIKKRIEGENGQDKPEKIARWRKTIEGDSAERSVFVARVDGQIVGFLSQHNLEGKHFIGGLYVLSAVQGRGVGKKLMKQVFAWRGGSEPIYLHVASYNQNAIKFYEKFGFKRSKDVEVDEGALRTNTTPLPQIEMVWQP